MKFQPGRSSANHYSGPDSTVVPFILRISLGSPSLASPRLTNKSFHCPALLYPVCVSLCDGSLFLCFFLDPSSALSVWLTAGSSSIFTPVLAENISFHRRFHYIHINSCIISAIQLYWYTCWVLKGFLGGIPKEVPSFWVEES